MGEKKELGKYQHPVFQVIGYLDKHSPFPAGSLLVALISGVYIANPLAGIFELIPDNIPLFGNLDEATAAFLLFWSAGNMIRWWRVRQARQRAQKEVKEEEV